MESLKSAMKATSVPLAAPPIESAAMKAMQAKAAAPVKGAAMKAMQAKAAEPVKAPAMKAHEGLAAPPVKAAAAKAMKAEAAEPAKAPAMKAEVPAIDGWQQPPMHGMGAHGLANGVIVPKIKDPPQAVIEQMIAARLAKRIAK